MTLEQAKQLKPGDKLRVLEDNADMSTAKAGDIFSFNGKLYKTYLGVDRSDGLSWSFAFDSIEPVQSRATADAAPENRPAEPECRCSFINLGHDGDCAYARRNK